MASLGLFFMAGRGGELHEFEARRTGVDLPIAAVHRFRQQTNCLNGSFKEMKGLVVGSLKRLSRGRKRRAKCFKILDPLRGLGEAS